LAASLDRKQRANADLQHRQLMVIAVQPARLPKRLPKLTRTNVHNEQRLPIR